MEKKKLSGPVNPPVMRACTIIYDSVQSWKETRKLRETQRVLGYGARGTDTAFALEDLVCKFEGRYRAQLYPTGLAALATVILKYAHPGKHILFADTIYGPVRTICTNATLLTPEASPLPLTTHGVLPGITTP